MLRRTTLGPLSSSQPTASATDYNNNLSQIPQPRASRLSSIGPPSRLSTAVSRQSLAAVTSEINNLAITPRKESRLSTSGRQSISRRSSVYSGRNSVHANALSNSNHQTITRDPRPIRDPSWRTACVRLLINFLTDAGFNRDISPKLLSAPSVKDFVSIFQFLYSKLDPNYKWMQGRKLEEELPFLMKGLKYPFAEQITKSQVQAIVSPHTWPTFLSLLIWMVELICVSQQVECEVDENGDNNAEMDGNQIFHVYLVKTYQEFLRNGSADVGDGISETLHESFRAKDEMLLQDIQRLEQENNELEIEWKKLKSEVSPLIKIKQEKVNYESDVSKLKKWKEALLEKKSQISEQLKVMKEDQNELDLQLGRVATEKQDLQQIVENQELSPSDVDRMNQERDQLTKTFDMLSEKLKEASAKVWELEIEANKKMDSIERNGKSFNDKCYRVELLPKSTSKVAKGRDFEFKLVTMSQQFDKTKTSIDLREDTKNGLMDFQATLKTCFLKEQENLSTFKDECDKVIEQIFDKNETLRGLEAKVRQLEEQYESQKITLNADLETRHKEIETLERELRKAKLDQTRSIFDCQRMARELELEIDNVARKTGEQKEKTISKFFAICERIVAFRGQLTSCLGILKDAVDEEIVKVTSAGNDIVEEEEEDDGVESKSVSLNEFSGNNDVLADVSCGSVLKDLVV